MTFKFANMKEVTKGKIQKSRSLMEMKQFHWFHPRDAQVNVVLLENISQVAVRAFQATGFNVRTKGNFNFALCNRILLQVEHVKGSLEGDELKEKIQKAHIIGIRSKTNLTREVLDCADNLVAIGCFCIGTNQVDLAAAAEKGVGERLLIQKFFLMHCSRLQYSILHFPIAEVSVSNQPIMRQ